MTLDIRKWMDKRAQQGTVEHMVRAMVHSGGTYERAADTLRMFYLAEVLVANCGNVSKAAESLGMNRNRLSRMLRPYGIDLKQMRNLGAALTQGERQ